jgi:FkbM family methyltransferase
LIEDQWQKISLSVPEPELLNEKPIYIQAKTFWGAEMHLFPRNEVVSSKIYSFGLFEPELTVFFIDFLYDGATVMDIGAHIGFFSMLASELVGKRGKVLSFEPTPSTMEVLDLNLRPYPQHEIIAKAAWSSNTQLDFHDYGIQYSAYNTAVSDRLNPEEKKEVTESLIKVGTVTLDTFCAERSIRPDLIKIDAESAEMQVLQGMVNLMNTVRPVVTIEVGDMDSTLKEGVPRCRDILEYALGFDYLPLNSIGGRYHLHELQDKYVYDNIIIVPREKVPARRPLSNVAVQCGRFY